MMMMNLLRVVRPKVSNFSWLKNPRDTRIWPDFQTSQARLSAIYETHVTGKASGECLRPSWLFFPSSQAFETAIQAEVLLQEGQPQEAYGKFLEAGGVLK